jgi:hypothetical protein
MTCACAAVAIRGRLTPMTHSNGDDDLTLSSFHLFAPVEGAHLITLNLGPEQDGQRKGTLRLDRNTCQINEWGDRTICTRMAALPIEVVATRSRALDPGGHKRVLYGLSSEQSEQGSLIEYPRAGLWYLVRPQKEGPTQIVPLFPAELFIPDSTGAVGMRYGAPIRKLIELGDLAEMKREAAAARAALSALDPPSRSRRGLSDEHVKDVEAALAELEAKIAQLEG